jgi:probable phosphoglycerate mutase
MEKTIPLVSFYFIRHGETDWNLNNMFQGGTDIPLNETGRAQARNAVAALEGKSITRIVASPLIRAYTTAELINQQLRVPLYVADGLKERSLGVFEGTVKDRSVIENGFNHHAPIEKGECVDTFQTRIATALHDILDPEHTTLIVAHGGVYWALMDMIGFKEQRSHNCVPYLFVPPNGKQNSWTVHQLTVRTKVAG